MRTTSGILIFRRHCSKNADFQRPTAAPSPRPAKKGEYLIQAVQRRNACNGKNIRSMTRASIADVPVAYSDGVRNG